MVGPPVAWTKHITGDRGTDVLGSLTCDDTHACAPRSAGDGWRRVHLRR